MRHQRRPTGFRRRFVRRLIGWVWHTDHDDRVPNVVNGVIVIAMVVVMVVGATSVWLILGLVAVFVAAVLLAEAASSPIRRPSEQGRLHDSIASYRAMRRNSGGRS